MTDETLLTLTADIVSSHVSNNDVASDQLAGLIQSVYSSLEGLGKSAPVIEEKLEPAVSIRSSVKADAITCLECGKKFKSLKRHLGTSHGLTPADYRARWSLGRDYPMVSPAYAAQRSDMATRIGLGRKPQQKVKVVRKPRATKAPAAAAS
jgi:predicted transcriptional regulator